MPKKDPIVTKKDVIIFFGIFILMFSPVIYSGYKVMYPQAVRTKVVKNLKKELKEEKIITDMKCYFFRPDLNFKLKVKEDFKEEKLYEILNYLNKYVDSGDLDKVSEKVDWTRFNRINIEVFKPSNDKYYPEYKMNAEYKINRVGAEKEEILKYKEWNIEKYTPNEEQHNQYEHIDKVKFGEKE